MLNTKLELKRKIMSFFLLTAVIANVVFIFYNSSQTADESDKASKSLAVMLFELKSKLDRLGLPDNDEKTAVSVGGAAGAKSETDKGSADGQPDTNADVNADTDTKGTGGTESESEKLFTLDKSDNPLFDTHEIKALNSKIRRYSHAAEFLPLGFLLSLLFVLNAGSGGTTAVVSRKQTAMFAAFAISVFCAAVDECYQISVDGRAFEVSDLLLDSVGSCSGVILACAFFIAAVRIKKSV